MVLPGGGKGLDLSVVSGKSVDSGLDENKSEFTILIGSELLNMLSDVDSLLDQAVEVLGKGGGESVDLQDSEDLGASDTLNLRDTVLISEDNTDLRRSGTLSGELADLLNEIGGGNLDPGWGSLSVRQRSTGNTFSLGVHSTHG